MAGQGKEAQKQLTELEQYRKKTSDDLKCYIRRRIAVIFICLLSVGYLTYLVGGFNKQLEINLFGKILMFVFIGLALLLAGFVIYRMPIHYKRIQTVLARLDALNLRIKLEEKKKSTEEAKAAAADETASIAAKAVYDAVKSIADSKADEAKKEESDAKATAEAVAKGLEEAVNAAEAALPEKKEQKKGNVIDLDRELQMIVRILES